MRTARSRFSKENVPYVIKAELRHLKKNLQKIIQFSCQKVRSESGTIIPDPDTNLPKSPGSDQIRLHNTAQCHQLNYSTVY
jgi:hypothetical protein